MPLTSIVVQVRGWGPTPEESEAAALDRLAQFNVDAQAHAMRPRQGVIYRAEDPGNGGPCGPTDVRVQNFEYLMASDDLPEKIAAQKKP